MVVKHLRLEVGRDAWHELALCREVYPDMFFPERGESLWEAKSTCSRCPVRAECLAEAFAIEDAHGMPVHGIWGGLSQRQRDELRRQGVAA